MGYKTLYFDFYDYLFPDDIKEYRNLGRTSYKVNETQKKFLSNFIYLKYNNKLPSHKSMRYLNKIANTQHQNPAIAYNNAFKNTTKIYKSRVFNNKKFKDYLNSLHEVYEYSFGVASKVGIQALYRLQSDSINLEENTFTIQGKRYHYSLNKIVNDENTDVDLDDIGIYVNDPLEHKKEFIIKNSINALDEEIFKDRDYGRRTRVEKTILEPIHVNVIANKSSADKVTFSVAREVELNVTAVEDGVVSGDTFFTWYNIEYTLQDSNFLKVYYYVKEFENALFIKYKEDGEVKLKVIKDTSIFYDYSNFKMKMTSYYDLNKLPNKGSKEYNIMFKHLYENGYTTEWIKGRRKSKKNTINKTTFEEIKSQEGYRSAGISQIFPLHRYLFREAQESKVWQRFLLSWFNFFEDKIEFGTDSNNSPVITLENFATLQMYKKSIANKLTSKACYIQKRDGDLWLILNVVNTELQEANEPLKYYTQYGLNFEKIFGKKQEKRSLLKKVNIDKWYYTKNIEEEYIIPVEELPNLRKVFNNMNVFMPSVQRYFRMPYELWLKTPYFVKKEVFAWTPFLHLSVTREVKKKKWYQKGVFKIALAIAAIATSYVTGGASLAAFVALVTVASHVLARSKLAGAFAVLNIIIQIGIAFYTGGASLLNLTMSVISVSTAVLSAVNYFTGLKYSKNLNTSKSELDILNDEIKEVKDEMREFTDFLDLRKFNINTDFIKDIDDMFSIAFGELVYNSFHNEAFMYSSYVSYEKDFNRFE